MLVGGFGRIMVGVANPGSSRPCIELLRPLDYCSWPYRAEVMHWFCEPMPPAIGPVTCTWSRPAGKTDLIGRQAEAARAGAAARDATNGKPDSTT